MTISSPPWNGEALFRLGSWVTAAVALAVPPRPGLLSAAEVAPPHESRRPAGLGGEKGRGRLGQLRPVVADVDHGSGAGEFALDTPWRGADPLSCAAGACNRLTGAGQLIKLVRRLSLLDYSSFRQR